MVQRFDRAELGSPERLPNGMLRVDARLTRTGVFVYRSDSGEERREYRPPDEVFAAEHLDSIRLSPLTLHHPPEPVTADNAARYMRGAVEVPRRDGEFVTASLLVSHRDAIDSVERGDTREISLGYRVDLDETPGETPDGERYDAIQRNPRVNHTALVTRGRAGPDVSIRMDASAWVLADIITGESNVKIHLDGVDYDAPEQTAQAVKAHLEKIAQRLDDADEKSKALQAELDKTAARADAAEKAKEQAEKERADAADPARVADAVRARLSLERTALRILGDDFKMDALDDGGIMAAVIAKHFDGIVTEGKSADYVQGLYEAAVKASESKPGAALSALRQAAHRADADNRKTPDQAREEMIRHLRSLHTKPAA